MTERPLGSNVDEWHLFLCQHLDSRATCPDGLAYMAALIAQAIEDAFEDGCQYGEQRAVENAAHP